MAGGARRRRRGVSENKALISFAVTAKLICFFVFAYAKSRFSHDAAHIMFVSCFVLSNFRMLKDYQNLISLFCQYPEWNCDVSISFAPT